VPERRRPGGRAAGPAAAQPDPRDLLRRLSGQYYDVGQAGLARASCFVESREILDQLDDTAKTLLKRPDFEAVLVPGKPVVVKVQDLPPEYGAEARKGGAAYCLGAALVLNAVFGALNTVPDLLDPQRVAERYDIQLDGSPGAWRIVLTSTALVDEDGKAVPFGQQRVGLAKTQPRERLMIALDRNDRVRSIRKATATGTQEIGVSSDEVEKHWLITGLDIANYDEQERLVQRQIVSISYTRHKGLHLPSRISSKAVDRDGRVLRRRDEPNPVTIRFSRYRIELRE
jgi:hypothetical protein